MEFYPAKVYAGIQNAAKRDIIHYVSNSHHQSNGFNSAPISVLMLADVPCLQCTVSGWVHCAKFRPPGTQRGKENSLVTMTATTRLSCITDLLVVVQPL